MFQCPTSGFFLFYEYKDSEGRLYYGNVSMPYLGLLPFLRLILLYFVLMVPVCFNALPRASSFSTQHQQQQQAMLLKGFNALPRASSFSTVQRKGGFMRTNTVFQCPTSGFFLFYDNFINQLLQRYNVSMPYLGLLPFLLAGRRGIVSKENRMFQCPTSGFFLFYEMETL